MELVDALPRVSLDVLSVVMTYVCWGVPKRTRDVLVLAFLAKTSLIRTWQRLLCTPDDKVVLFHPAASTVRDLSCMYWLGAWNKKDELTGSAIISHRQCQVKDSPLEVMLGAIQSPPRVMAASRGQLWVSSEEEDWCT